jgi:predicted NBD/HSP70 family sugar kinase
MNKKISVQAAVTPVLDPGFIPSVLWNRAFRECCAKNPDSRDLAVAISRPDGTVFVHRTRILPDRAENTALNNRYVERLVKFLLWQAGGNTITIAGADEVAAFLRKEYSLSGARAFDAKIFQQMFLAPVTVVSCGLDEIPAPREQQIPLGRNLDGYRIGFDLGGSDRKAAAVIDGKVVFSEEIRWDPYFQKDPQYHYEGIRDSLKRAAAHLPRVDAIGGSAAGCYINNEARVSSLFRGISNNDFDQHIRRIFFRLKEEWGNVPFDVANDGEVTALAGAMSLNDHSVLGISMGTSQAVGYCNANGHITAKINEPAFAPIDYREDAPADEWSGDLGCGVQYFSQQGVARLIPASGIDLPADMPLPEKLVAVQNRMEKDDARARKIYETIGTCFGYAIAQYAEFYSIRHILFLGRVSSGKGGQVIIQKAEEVLAAEFPELTGIKISMPDEHLKRHGQAIAAASLPAIPKKSS